MHEKGHAKASEIGKQRWILKCHARDMQDLEALTAQQQANGLLSNIDEIRVCQYRCAEWLTILQRRDILLTHSWTAACTAAPQLMGILAVSPDETRIEWCCVKKNFSGRCFPWFHGTL